MQPAAPTPIRAEGAYHHPGSHMVFPERVGPFQRVQITQFAPSEKNVGIGYNHYNARAPVSATVYVYPAPRVVSLGSPPGVAENAKAHLLQGHLEALKKEILGAHPDARLISDEAFALAASGGPHEGRRVRFEFACRFGSGPQDAISELYLFQDGNWLVKYRITFPKVTASEAQAAVAELLAGPEWPKK